MNFRSTIARVSRGEPNGDPCGKHRKKARAGGRSLRAAGGVGVAALAAGIAASAMLSQSQTQSVNTSAINGAPAAVAPAVQSPNGAPQLHVSGNQLLSAAGQRVVLHGVDRSGTEFMCAQGHGIFDGPDTTASVQVMKSYGINAVRVPLNEACWNGDSYIKAGYAGTTYRQAVAAYVNRLNASGIIAILDLHWTNGVYTGPASACVDATATCQKPMPDAAGAIPFWKSVAGTFKGNDAVVFDLFNEPYPEQADHNNYSEGWNCWQHGGSACVGINYPVAGMQSMVDAVRSTGANNVLMLGGLEWSNNLSGWLAHEPVDPDHNLAASWHSYNFNACSTTACWDSQIAPVIAKVPVIAGEIGENDCTGKYIDGLTKWLNAKSANYLAWTWNSDFNCSSGPGLITSYTGQPTAFGAAYEADLRGMVSTASHLTH